MSHRLTGTLEMIINLRNLSNQLPPIDPKGLLIKTISATLFLLFERSYPKDRLNKLLSGSINQSVIRKKWMLFQMALKRNATTNLAFALGKMILTICKASEPIFQSTSICLTISERRNFLSNLMRATAPIFSKMINHMG